MAVLILICQTLTLLSSITRLSSTRSVTLSCPILSSRSLMHLSASRAGLLVWLCACSSLDFT